MVWQVPQKCHECLLRDTTRLWSLPLPIVSMEEHKKNGIKYLSIEMEEFDRASFRSLGVTCLIHGWVSFFSLSYAR